jgi:hypothetical protein
VAEAAATGAAGNLHIRVEVVVLLVAEAHNWNNLLGLSRRLLWPTPYLSLLASGSSIVKTRYGFRLVILQHLDLEGLGGWISIEGKDIAVGCSHMSPIFISNVAVVEASKTYGRGHEVFTDRHD